MASMNVWARSRTALSMAALLALAACGGGGGSSSSGGTPSTVAVSGVASKGLLLNAVVTAYAVNADGTKGNKLASVTTSATDGSYTLTGLPAGALVLLEVTPQAGTKMVDEATNLQLDVPASSGFALRAAVNLDSKGETSAQITPFTNMAVTLAEANGGLKPDVVAASNGSVSAFAGISILTDKPTFANVGGDVVATNAAGAKLAALSALASDSALGCNAADQLSRVACVVTKLADSTTSDDVATALNSLPTSDISISDPLELAKATAPVTTPPATVTVVAGTQTAIQEAKTLIASVRATATALSNKSDATSLATRVQAVADASRGVAQPLDDSTMTLLTALSEAITAHEDPATGLNFQLNSGVWWNGQPVSGCRYFTSDNFEIAASARTAYLGCRVVQRLGYTSGQPFMAYHRFGVIDGGTAGYTVKSRLGRALIISASPLVLGTEDLLSGASPRSLTVVSGQNALTVTGELAPGIESNWDTGTETAVVLGTHQKVALTLGEVVGATTTRYNLSGDVSVYSDTNVQSRVSLKSGSYIEEANVAGPTQPKAANLILEAQLKTGYKIGGTLVLSNFEQTATHNGPKNATLIGYLTDMTGSAKLFDGTLTLIMPTDTGVNWDMKLDGTLATTGANTLAVNLTALQPTLGEVTVTGRYTQGATTFLLTLLSSKTTPANDQLSLTTTAGGVGFVAKRSDTVVPIKKGSTELGQFNVGSSRVVYADGTYEQF
ncbi:hypothetical protein WIT60_00605 [Aquabacterium sp. G14]